VTSSESLRVGFLGRVPPPLGGGGLELQMARTAEALARAGNVVVQLEAAGPDERFDVLHAFGSEPANWHHLRHWTRNRAPLVVTSVVVVSPGPTELALRLSARVPGVLTSGRMRRQLLGEADAVVAGTQYERRLLIRAFGVPEERLVVIDNGADRRKPGALPGGLPARYTLLAGAVSKRKRQAEVLEALGDERSIVVAGGYAGSVEEKARWERAVAKSGARWLGHVGDPATMAALQRNATALVHLSSGEVQSLSVLEALAQGTPAVLSDIPSHRELEAAFPSHVRVVGGPSEVPQALGTFRDEVAGEAPAVPTWDDVAAQLTELYRRLLRTRPG